MKRSVATERQDKDIPFSGYPSLIQDLVGPRSYLRREEFTIPEISLTGCSR